MMTASTSPRSQPAARFASARMLLSHLLLACHSLSATNAFAATRRPLAPPRQPPRRAVAAAATKTRYKRVSLDFIEFGAELSLDAAVRGGGGAAALGAFLTPARAVGAAWKPENVEKVGGGDGPDSERYRLKQDPLDFAALRVNTYVDVDVTPTDRGGLDLESRDIVCKASWAGQPEPVWTSHLQYARHRTVWTRLFPCASRTRRERSIRPKISRIDFDVTERENFEVWSGRPKPAVDFGTGPSASWTCALT